MHLYSICKNQIQLVIIRLYIPKTLSNPEVRIQIRLERYPNRRVDFSKLVAKSFLLKKVIFGMLGRYVSQEQLVQPTNATV